MFYTSIINTLKQRTNKVILFHSGTGKDSIALCDILSKQFEKVVCIFMYLVPELDFENKYITWAERKYSNITFYKTPHFVLNSFIKRGYLGIKIKKSINNMTISKIDKMARLKFNIDFSVYGMKKNDGFTRRIQLNAYKNGICEATNKAYPLLDMKNSEVLNYISDNDLIHPFNYGGIKPSSGCDISNPEFLTYMRRYYPEDLKKIYNTFPMCEALLFKYDTYGEKIEA